MKDKLPFRPVRSVDTADGAIVKYRASSKGKVFTRNERVALILAERERKREKGERAEILAATRKAIAAEREAREFASRKRQAEIKTNQKIKVNKDGGLFYQERVKGKFGPRVAV